MIINPITSTTLIPDSK